MYINTYYYTFIICGYIYIYIYISVAGTLHCQVWLPSGSNLAHFRSFSPAAVNDTVFLDLDPSHISNTNHLLSWRLPKMGVSLKHPYFLVGFSLINQPAIGLPPVQPQGLCESWRCIDQDLGGMSPGFLDASPGQASHYRARPTHIDMWKIYTCPPFVISELEFSVSNLGIRECK